MSRTNPVQVVIIDDDSSVRWIIEQTLDLANVTYVSAATGPEGIQLINQHVPPVAIVDVKLGAMSGLDVLRNIRAPQNTKVLLVTGYASTIEDLIVDLPVMGVLEKPFDIQQLSALVQNALRASA